MIGCLGFLMRLSRLNRASKMQSLSTMQISAAARRPHLASEQRSSKQAAKSLLAAKCRCMLCLRPVELLLRSGVGSRFIFKRRAHRQHRRQRLHRTGGSKGAYAPGPWNCLVWCLGPRIERTWIAKELLSTCLSFVRVVLLSLAWLVARHRSQTPLLLISPTHYTWC